MQYQHSTLIHLPVIIINYDYYPTGKRSQSFLLIPWIFLKFPYFKFCLPPWKQTTRAVGLCYNSSWGKGFALLPSDMSCWDSRFFLMSDRQKRENSRMCCNYNIYTSVGVHYAQIEKIGQRRSYVLLSCFLFGHI